MCDIHQEWADLRKKNGEFICHLDGEMAKLEKAKLHQDLIDAIAADRQFFAQPPLSCCPNNSDILKALDKAQAERDNLADTVTKMDKTIRDLKERISNLRARLANKNSDLEELYLVISNKEQALNELAEQNKNLRDALDQAAKDAEASFNRGRIKGMEEIWNELRDVYSGRPTRENEKIFGYGTTGEIIKNLSPTWFINRAEEYHEEEKKIKIGDEVRIFDTFCPDDDPHSDMGIVIAIGEDNPCFTIVGPKFQAFFDETDIDSGRVKKTGRHFDSVPLDYLA